MTGHDAIMRQPLAMILTLGALTFAAPPEMKPADDSTTRPAVFRCVLDGNARMIVVQLGDDVFAAYDANRCSLSKLWRGEVVLTGPVYDTRHGPQPKSKGTQLLGRPVNLAPTPAAPATRPTDYANVDGYRGYTTAGGRMTVRFDFDGITVAETLEVHDRSAKELVIRRTLDVGGAVSTDRPFAVQLPDGDALEEVTIVDATAPSIAARPSEAAAKASPKARFVSLGGPGTFVTDLHFTLE